MDSIGSAFSTASAIQQEKTNMEVEMAVMKKSLGIQKMLGEAMIGLISQAAATSTAQTPGKAVGLGDKMDITG